LHALALHSTLCNNQSPSFPQQVINNKTDDYIVEKVDDLIRLPKISEADLDKVERDIRTYKAFCELKENLNI
jgi:hypothetical protein